MTAIRHLLAFCYGLWVIGWVIASSIVVGTVAVLPFAVVPRGRRERFTIVPAAAWAQFVLRALLMCHIKVTGDSGLEADKGAIVFCNHRSWVDPLLLLAYTRSNGLSKLGILFIPFVGFFAWLTGAVFFDRARSDARARARNEVRKLVTGGARVHVFPEGTRTRDGKLAERVYLLLAMDCYADGVPVVPCAVWGTERALPVGRPLAFPLQPVRLHVGEALHPRDFRNSKEFARAAWDRVVRQVAMLEGEAMATDRS